MAAGFSTDSRMRTVSAYVHVLMSLCDQPKLGQQLCVQHGEVFGHFRHIQDVSDADGELSVFSFLQTIVFSSSCSSLSEPDQMTRQHSQTGYNWICR